MYHFPLRNKGSSKKYGWRRFLREFEDRDDKPTIFIDEGQFLTEEQVTQLTRLYDCRIHVFGLRTDYLGNPFRASALLLAYADCTHGYRKMCESDGCYREATMNILLDEEGNRIYKEDIPTDVDDDRWVSVCPQCFYGI